MANAVDIREVTHRYSERVALDSVNLRIGSGEFFGLLGPNGGGKSTLFKIISTLILPTAGEIFVSGASVREHPAEVRKKIGVVFQSPALDKKLTVSENLWAEGLLHGWRGSELKREISQLLTLFGIADRAKEKTEKLSGGLKRRVELARALLHRPSILLLDEPTTGLDPLARREIWEYLKGLQKSQGMTVVLTTHLMDEAEQCSRIAILHHGKILAEGTPQTLRETSVNDVVWLYSRDIDALSDALKREFSVETAIMDGELRFEAPDAHQMVSPIMSKLGNLVQSVRVGKPTLEDYFIRQTGTRFGSERSLDAL